MPAPLPENAPTPDDEALLEKRGGAPSDSPGIDGAHGSAYGRSLGVPAGLEADAASGSGLGGAGVGEAGRPKAPTVEQDEWRHSRFQARARALVFVRLAALAGGLALLLIPGWAAALGVDGPIFRLLLAGMALAGVIGVIALPGRRLLPRRRQDSLPPSAGSHPPRARRAAALRTLTYASLCLDVVAATYLIAATGGLRSPLLALQVGLAAVFALLFPRPLAALPTLLMLPVVAHIDHIVGGATGGLFDLLAIVGYGALDLAIIFLVVESNRREDAWHRQMIRLERALGELAVAEVRARLSREMHDGLGASLTSLSMQSEFLQTIAPEGPLRDEAVELRKGSEEALEELRHSLHVMRGDFDLVHAARSHCEAMTRRGRIPIAFSDDEAAGGSIPAEAQLALFRLLQEAVSNAIRHGAPQAVEVALRRGGRGWELTIRDDGRGFDPTVEKAGHYGLRGMHERARRWGGELSLRSRPGAGTEIHVRIPPAT